MTLLVPGKTFLIGEYSVLVGGKSLAVASGPYFKSTAIEYFPHAESAAGLLLNGKQSYKMENPYGCGGFGLSTAEFIQAWLSLNNVKKITSEKYKNIFNDYRNLYDQNKSLQKMKPSGADLITQLVGGITYFDTQSFISEAHAWPFPEIEFGIISTGQKIPTHSHLSQIDLKKLESFPQVSDGIIQSFLKKDVSVFIDGLKSWRDFLKSEGMQHNFSSELVKALEKSSSILCAKPNGALGADTVTIFYNRENKNEVTRHLKQLNLELLTNSDHVSQGAHYVD